MQYPTSTPNINEMSFQSWLLIFSFVIIVVGSLAIVKVNIENLRKHLEKRNHDNMIKYLSRISDLLENPDYIGINPREREKSIEYVIQLEENVLIGIKLDYKNEYFYIATMHEISQLKLNQRIKNGRLKSLTT